jgi:predicted RNase H-like HicB family nuclease
MQVPVLVELLGDRPGYLARLGEPFNLTAEAGTPEEALHELSRAVQLRLQTGARLMPLTLPSPSTPFGVHGWLPDDELTHEWQQAVEDYRRDCDEADRRRILGETADEKAAS